MPCHRSSFPLLPSGPDTKMGNQVVFKEVSHARHWWCLASGPHWKVQPGDYFCSTFCFGKSLGFLHKFSSINGRGEWNEHLQFVLYVLVFLFLNVKWQIWNLYLSKHKLLQGLCFWYHNSCQSSLLLLGFCARKQQGKRA